MNFDYNSIVILILLWCAYFALHSTLASLRIKHWVSERWPKSTKYYRLAFNVIACILIIFPLTYMHIKKGNLIWQWQGIYHWISNGIILIALSGFYISTRYYDMKEFLGYKQLKQNHTSIYDQEALYISPFHRYVRHPWYLFAIIILWSRDMDILMLTTATLLTSYFLLGSRLEERKLKIYHGDIYRKYIQKVPGIFPCPWKHINKEQADALTNQSD